MYVLMDLEWCCGDGGRIFPTQMAALRIGERWQRLDLFFSRIRPECANVPNWAHMAFSGGAPEDFLSASALPDQQHHHSKRTARLGQRLHPLHGVHLPLPGGGH